MSFKSAVDELKHFILCKIALMSASDESSESVITAVQMEISSSILYVEFITFGALKLESEIIEVFIRCIQRGKNSHHLQCSYHSLKIGLPVHTVPSCSM